MIQTASVVPPNSLVFLISAAEPEISTDLASAIAATDTCVSIGTQSEMDGPTTITLADEDVDVSALTLMYRGELDTALARVAVQTVDGEQIAQLEVPTARTAVAVWGSDPEEPDQVIIRLG